MTEAVRPTAAEQQEREDVAFDLLCRCVHKGEIKRRFIKEYGVSARTVETYLSRARERMRLEAVRATDELRAESLGFYMATLRNGNATIRERLQARTRIDQLFGLDAPTKQEHKIDLTGLSDDDLVKLAELTAKLNP